MTQLASSILSHFPSTYSSNGHANQAHVAFAFGYGSGVLKQQQDVNKSSGSQNQVDLIVAVNNSFKFHEENLKINSNHYSFLRHFGAPTITRLQETRGARIYFNPYVKFDNDPNTLYKYGIISRRHLIRDLLDWETLYVAGRLQVRNEVLNERGIERKILRFKERARPCLECRTTRRNIRGRFSNISACQINVLQPFMICPQKIAKRMIFLWRNSRSLCEERRCPTVDTSYFFIEPRG